MAPAPAMSMAAIMGLAHIRVLLVILMPSTDPKGKEAGEEEEYAIHDAKGERRF